MLVAAFIIVAFVLGVAVASAVLYFRDAPLAAQLSKVEAELAQERARVNRMMEAMANHGNIPLVIPDEVPRPLEKGSGWFDKIKSPGPAAVTVSGVQSQYSNKRSVT